jgi:hypothetical protein
MGLSYALSGLSAILLIRNIYLMFRVSAYRADRPQQQNVRFGVPYFSNWKYWQRKNFTAEGYPLLRTLQRTTVVWGILTFTAALLLG